MNKAEELALKVKEKGGRAFYVGGYVRDFLMHKENKDIDIEVHGLDENVLLEILNEIGRVNYFGKSFGIYSLEGENIEIAMPRSEKLVGSGHKDFLIDVDKDLGYKKAALRRDFTINAIIMDVLSGEILDFFNGREDLHKGIIRHINDEKFQEDPLRVVRACQFAARFNFSIADETIELCKKIDISTLPCERIEEELKKALTKSNNPFLFFDYLKKMNITLYFNNLNCFNHLNKYGNQEEVHNTYYFKMALIAIDNKDYLKSFKQFTNNKELLQYVKKIVDLYNSLFKDKTDFIMKMLSFPHFFDITYMLNEKENEYFKDCYKRYQELKGELISGETLINWGYKPNEKFGQILEYAKRLQIKGCEKEQIRLMILKIFTKK